MDALIKEFLSPCYYYLIPNMNRSNVNIRRGDKALISLSCTIIIITIYYSYLCYHELVINELQPHCQNNTPCKLYKNAFGSHKITIRSAYSIATTHVCICIHLHLLLVVQYAGELNGQFRFFVVKCCVKIAMVINEADLKNAIYYYLYSFFFVCGQKSLYRTVSFVSGLFFERNIKVMTE